MYTFYQEENSFSEEYGESGIPINVSTTQFSTFIEYKTDTIDTAFLVT